MVLIVFPHGLNRFSHGLDHFVGAFEGHHRIQVVADFGRGELAQSAVRFEAVDYSLEVRRFSVESRC